MRMTETFAFYLLTSTSPWCGGEGGHSKSRALKQRSLLQRGPAPSYAPHAGDTSPTIPLFESHPLYFSSLPSFPDSSLNAFLWRRGWDSNPRSHCWDACFPSMSIRPLSHLSAPIFARRHLNTRSDDRQGEETASTPGSADSH